MTPEQRERFERLAILEAHANLLINIARNGMDDELSGQLARLAEAVSTLAMVERKAA